MHIHTCTYVHAHTYMHIHTCTYVHAHTYMHIRTCTYIHAHTYMHIHTCTYVHAHTYMHIRTCTYVHAHTYMHIHTYPLTQVGNLEDILDVLNSSGCVSVAAVSDSAQHTPTCIRAHAYVHMHTCTCTHPHTCTHAHMHMCTHAGQCGGGLRLWRVRPSDLRVHAGGQPQRGQRSRPDTGHIHPTYASYCGSSRACMHTCMHATAYMHVQAARGVWKQSRMLEEGSFASLLLASVRGTDDEAERRRQAKRELALVLLVEIAKHRRVKHRLSFYSATNKVAHLHAHAYMHIHTCTYIHVHAHVCVHIHICMHIHTCACTCACRWQS